MQSVFDEIYRALLEPEPQQKCRLAGALYQAWCDAELSIKAGCEIEAVEVPGRPARLQLVDPRQVPRRSLASEHGRQVMLHAFAHIEFNAINLALDAAYRFRDMPEDFIGDWLKVASEEACHFTLINDYLKQSGCSYGELPAHDGLWDMACKTRGDVLHRMALVPRVMEARGLDVTPGLIKRFGEAGDQGTVDILQIIYDDEIGHVEIGNRWYHYCCKQRGLEPTSTFRDLINTYFNGPLRGPFNHDARLSAGFTEDELTQLENSL